MSKNRISYTRRFIPYVKGCPTINIYKHNVTQPWYQIDINDREKYDVVDTVIFSGDSKIEEITINANNVNFLPVKKPSIVDGLYYVKFVIQIDFLYAISYRIDKKSKMCTS